jgi:hypothetical protein
MENLLQLLQLAFWRKNYLKEKVMVFFTKHRIMDNGIVSAHRRRTTEKGRLAARVSISITVILKDKGRVGISRT